MTDQVTTATQPEQTVAPVLGFEMSPAIGKLVEALAKASKAFKPVIKDAENPFFKSKYADLASVIEATREALGNNGLAILQPPAYRRESGTVEIRTLLAHSSGEWISSRLEMPMGKQDAQAVGSAITYGRRYAYSAVLNVASEQDDDANAAVSKDFKKKQETTDEFDQRTEGQQFLKVFEIQAMDEACKRTGKSEEEVAAFLSLIGEDRIEHIKRTDFKQALAWANTTGKTIPKTPKQKATDAVKAIGGTAVAASLLSPAKKTYSHAWPKVWGTATEKGIPQDDVKRYYRETYGVEHGNELTPLEFGEVVVWLSEQQ